MFFEHSASISFFSFTSNYLTKAEFARKPFVVEEVRGVFIVKGSVIYSAIVCT